MKICDNCGIDLTGTTLFERHGSATLCLVCSTMEIYLKGRRRKRKNENL